jgi:hypothetical protein
MNRGVDEIIDRLEQYVTVNHRKHHTLFQSLCIMRYGDIIRPTAPNKCITQKAAGWHLPLLVPGSQHSIASDSICIRYTQVRFYLTLVHHALLGIHRNAAQCWRRTTSDDYWCIVPVTLTPTPWRYLNQEASVSLSDPPSIRAPIHHCFTRFELDRHTINLLVPHVTDRTKHCVSSHDLRVDKIRNQYFQQFQSGCVEVYWGSPDNLDVPLSGIETSEGLGSMGLMAAPLIKRSLSNFWMCWYGHALLADGPSVGVTPDWFVPSLVGRTDAGWIVGTRCFDNSRVVKQKLERCASWWLWALCDPFSTQVHWQARIHRWVHRLDQRPHEYTDLAFVARGLIPVEGCTHQALWNVFHGCFTSPGWDPLRYLRCTMTTHHHFPVILAMLQQQSPHPRDRIIHCTNRDSNWWLNVVSVLFCPYVLHIDASDLLCAIQNNRVPVAVVYVINAQAAELSGLYHWLDQLGHQPTNWEWAGQPIKIHDIQFWLLIHTKSQPQSHVHPPLHRLSRHMKHFTNQPPTRPRRSRRSDDCECMPHLYKRQCHREDGPNS